MRLIRGDIYKNLARTSSATGAEDEAERYRELALKEFEPIKEDQGLKAKHPEEFAGALNGIGNVQYERGRYREAIADFLRATSLVPDYAYAWYAMFIAYLSLAKRHGDA